MHWPPLDVLQLLYCSSVLVYIATHIVVAAILTSADVAIALLCTDDSHSHRQQLLRRVCQRLGIRVLSRAYDFTAAAPLQQDDIVDAVTVSKSCLPPSPHAEAAICVEHARSQVLCPTVLC
jgi:hypothetical protein